MHLPLPDFGDLVLIIALSFGALIFIFETLERRRESRIEHLLLEKIAREYDAYHELGYF
jgi:hypothetical protein